MNRRNFMTGAALAAGGISAGLMPRETSSQETPGAESWNRIPGIRKKDEKILSIGGVFGLWSHMSSSWWKYFNPPEGWARPTGMRISHVWCIDEEAGKHLAERYDAELVTSYDGMVGKVDGMFIDDFFVTPFMPDLSMPYLNAGIPCFFDRPMASSLKGAMQGIETSRKTGTPFMAPSAYEYLKEVEIARRRMPEIGDVVAYEGRNSASNVYMYALHGTWFILKCMGIDVVRVSHRTDNPVDAPGLTVLEHMRNGKRFYGAIHHAPLKNIMCSVRVNGTKGDFEVSCDLDGRPWHQDVYTYLELLHSFERMIRTRTAPEPLEYTEAKMHIFLSILHSAYAKNGASVEVAALPMEWDAGIPKGFSRSYSDDVVEKYRKVLKR